MAVDVCRSLDHSNVSMALGRLDDDEKAKLNLGLPGGATNVVTFPGLLSLVLGSRKPEAKAYKRWVTHEVLPAIHKTGGYMVSVADETPEQTMARALLMANDTIERQREQLAGQRERNRVLSARNEILEPRAELAEQVFVPTIQTYTVTEVARFLANTIPGVTRDMVIAKLRDTGMMCKRGTAPTRRGMRTGRMVPVAEPYTDAETGELRAGRQRGRLTSKGVQFLSFGFGGGAL